jgi:hypothetical protein
LRTPGATEVLIISAYMYKSLENIVQWIQNLENICRYRSLEKTVDTEVLRISVETEVLKICVDTKV